MRMLVEWMKASNRWKHLLGGALIGAVSNGYYCALLASGAAGAAMEYKDYAKGGKADAADFMLTVIGGAVGHGVVNAVIGVFV